MNKNFEKLVTTMSVFTDTLTPLTESPFKVVDDQAMRDLIESIVAFIMMMSFAFQINEIRLDLFYRKRELGSLQLFGFSKKKVLEYLVVERLFASVGAIICSLILFYGIALVLHLIFDIYIFIEIWKISVLISIMILYNISLTYVSAKKIIKCDIITLIR